jgi:hypothetical protein
MSRLLQVQLDGRKFSAPSGNEAMMHVSYKDTRVVIRCAWRTPPSETDAQDFEWWFVANSSGIEHVRTAPIVATEEEAKRLVETYLEDNRDERDIDGRRV